MASPWNEGYTKQTLRMNGFVVIVAGILGLALLVVVHESGHLLAARAFGMRVLRFSIGFGPALWRHQSKDQGTVYQIALIPFLAYVQIAGMNPFEEIDPNDKGSYANATLGARISAIIAGPLANYFFASVLFFAGLLVGGRAVPTTTVEVMEGGAAKVGQMQTGDTVVGIDGTAVSDWDEMRKLIVASPQKPLKISILRNKQPLDLQITPELKLEKGQQEGRIGVTPITKQVPIAAKEAAWQAIILPVNVVESLVLQLGRFITGAERPKLKGPVGIVQETSRAAERSWSDYVMFLGVLSAYLGGFNMIPFPALDGGRLAFLVYEAVTRRRPNARVEANVHALGLLMLLALIAVVSFFDVRGN